VTEPESAGHLLPTSRKIVQGVAAGGNAQVAALGSGVQIVHFHGESSRVPTVPAVALNSLPRDLAHFANREDVLDRIAGTATATAGDATNIFAIDGMAGVGKTALALRAAHRLVPAYPDAQLYLDLHAHSRGRTPVDPASGLETLLRVLGVPDREIPDSLDGRAALWRSHLANRRALIVLDNAANSSQVDPLLPGSGRCLVIVTSRRRLSGLEGAVRVTLDVLISDDAIRLFTWIVGPERVGPDRDAVRQIVESCARLPLAVSLCAARLKYRPVWSVRNLATELTRASDRLNELWAEDDTVASVFELSYRGLDPMRQRMFRRLGLHPAQDFSAAAAAALVGADLAEARRGLELLSDQNLVQEPRFGRYLLHDLLHEYAYRLASEEDSPDERALATDRLLDYYTFVAAQADRLINLLGSRNCQVEWEPANAPQFGSHAEAITWMETERANLHAEVRLAIEAGRLVRATQLARAMVYFLRLKGYWRDTLDLCQSITAVCEGIGDRAGVADLGFYCGDIFRLTGRYDEALRQYETALAAYRDLTDRHWEARTLHSIGDIERAEGRYVEAFDRYEGALTVYRELGNTLAEARALHSIGDAYRLSGRHTKAREQYRQILTIYRSLDDQVGEARVLHATGALNLQDGNLDEALTDTQHALDAFRLLGDRLGEADAQYGLGEIHQTLGNHEESLQHYEDALGAYRELGDQRGQAHTLRRSGTLLIAIARTHEGAAFLREALATFETLGAAETDEVRAEIERIDDDEQGPTTSARRP
jgi:tetratricopeptide (TPR) repeat protein